MLLDTRHNELTKEVIGGAMRVHSALGSGFPEAIYHRSLAIELTRIGLPFEQEIHLPVFYLNTQVGARRVDFLIDKCVLVELKAVTELTSLRANHQLPKRLSVGSRAAYQFWRSKSALQTLPTQPSSLTYQLNL